MLTEPAELVGGPLLATRGERHHQQVGAGRDAVDRAGPALTLDHHGPAAGRDPGQEVGGAGVVPVVQDVDEQVDVASRRQRGAGVAADDLQPVGRFGPSDDVGQVEQHAPQVRLVGQQRPQQGAGPAADVAH